ncbi:MAG: hypothetical protein U0599_27215 [Vicinamibacteria bacterium]
MKLPALLHFLAFAAVAVVAPGAALQQILRRRVDPAVVLPLGTAFCAGAYWLSLVLDRAWLFPTAVLVVLGAGAAAFRGDWAGRAEDEPTTERGPGWLPGVALPFAAILAFLALTQFPFNRRATDADRGFLLDPLVTSDSAFHVGLTRELVAGHPPQVPGVAGFPLGYHLGTDLVRAAALRWAAIDPWDSLTRLDVALWALALVLALAAAARRLGAPPLAVALAPWTLLLTDLSFVFAANPQAHWWADLLRGNVLLSLVYANPVVPALAMTLAALLALDDATRVEHGDRGSLVLAGALGAAVPFFKVFLGAHLLLGLGVAFLLGRPARRRPVLLAALPCALATAALVLGQGGETVAVSVAPFDLARITRETLGLAPASGVAFAAWAAFWVLASLGLRVTGLAEALRSLRGPVIASALATIALSGWPLGLAFDVSAPEVLPGQKFVNDAAYLVEQSGPVLWLFTLAALARFATTRARRAAALAAVLLLATPATVQYAVKKAKTPADRMPDAMVRAMDALGRVSRPGDVVLQRPGARFPPAPVVLAGRRVPYERFTPYLTQFATREALLARHEAVYRFFRTPDRAEALAIARSMDARFLALYGRDRVRFDTAGVLEPVFEEEGARVYRIVYP